MLGSSSVLVFSFYVVCIFGLVVVVAQVQAQNQTQATDPNEVSALNSIFQQWGLSMTWNTSADPCTGKAINNSIPIDDPNTGPLIKCVCSTANVTTNVSTCHITQLQVYALSVVGTLPNELWNLTSLTYLNLAQNCLTGPLSASIGNLTKMQYLALAINALSGELPKELGLLTNLLSLGIGTNNFSGSLPPELGNLTQLQQIYMDSSGVSGEIPPTFANLQNMTTLWASDTNLTGTIPDFIGNWSKLSHLRFQGNSFEGPIPSTFANLTSMNELRISDLSNGSSSLDFIRNMKSLTILELRNNNISDSIPSSIGEYQNLKQLDLSFNNLTGQIPESLFQLSSLAYLFLGNNSLNGSLPAQISASLLNIDVSYNNLGGTFPSWVNETNLQLNLVANNFTIETSNSSVLPSGLNCLQRNFPCNRGSGIYYNFTINCGGPQFTSSTGVVYESDNETLGPANYYVTNTHRWGVSNVGYFTDSSSPWYGNFSPSQFTGPNSELFQTARLSASSLRYYGLGLENGNYTVTLMFIETTIFNNNSWQSHGRRYFDIYIQGIRLLQDFDIKGTANVSSNQPVQKEFNAIQVSENYIEIHLFWAGKGTCCVPGPGIYGPSISAISATPEFTPTVHNNPASSKKNGTGLIAGIVVGVVIVSFLSLIAILWIVRRRKRPHHNEDEEFLELDARPYTFSYAELKAATEDFNPANKLGEGGFGPVYKGKLSDGRVIAAKQLSVTSRQGKSQFIAEIATISAVQQRNLVKLYGYCIERDHRLLVYEYLENKSLDQALFGEGSLKLSWPIRYDICLGVARGLAYLHEESRLRIVHRDVKASNILLDSDLIPKISDFGLAKLYDDKKTHISTRVAGTIGYLAPEYAMRGHLTEKTDVFAFGVLALEIVSGRPNSDSSLEEEKMYLLEWAWLLHENNSEVELVDSNLSEFSEEEVKRIIGVAFMCTQTSPMLRPPMSRVVAMLSGDIEVSTVTSRPGYLTDWKFDDVTSFMSDNLTSFKSNNATKASDTSYYNSTASTSMVPDVEHSPENVSKPILHRIIRKGW